MLLLLVAVNVSVLLPVCFASSFVLSFPASHVKHGHTLFGWSFYILRDRTSLFSKAGLIFGAYYGNIGSLGCHIVVTTTLMMSLVNVTGIRKRCGLHLSGAHLCTFHGMLISSNHRPVRPLQSWGGSRQPHSCWPRLLGCTRPSLCLMGMVPPTLTNSHMACTHSQEGPCPNLKDQRWDTRVSKCLDTPVHHLPTHPWLDTEEHQHPCRDILTSPHSHRLHPCRLTEEPPCR